jgi:hypothetical protein
VPQSADSTVADAGPCPGEQPRQESEARRTFYCAPLLTGATATAKR